MTSFVKSLAWADFSPEVIAEAESTLNSTVETVDALDVDRFTGRWFQVFFQSKEYVILILCYKEI